MIGSDFCISFSNYTGAYELNLTMVDDFAHAWCEMHIKTDVICSRSIVLVSHFFSTYIQLSGLLFI